MNPTTLHRTDDDFARALRDRVDAVAPDIEVHTHGVVPAARRVRRRRVAVTGVAAVGVLALGAAAVLTHPWDEPPTQVVPASSIPADAGTADSTDADAANPAAPGWPDAPYWRVRTQIHGTDTAGGEESSVEVDWLGHDRPGLLTQEGSDDVTSIGPSGWGSLVVDGERTLVGWDELYALPTDPASLEQILRDSVEPDRGAGTDDDKVFDMARSLLVASPAPPALRDGLWSVMTGLPTSTLLDDVVDSSDRPGEGVETTVQGWTSRLVYDPVNHRVLEESGSLDDDALADMRANGSLDGAITSTSTRTTYLEEGPDDAPPVEPSLENSGCVSWETC